MGLVFLQSLLNVVTTGANIGPRKVEMTCKAYQMLSQPGLAQALERERPSPTGASLDCQEPPLGAIDTQG
jgi:hypothetical protein